MNSVPGTTLDLPVERLPRVGTRRTEGLHSAGIHSVGDLLRYIPRRYLDRSSMPAISSLRPKPVPEGQKREITIAATIKKMNSVPRGRRRTVIILSDGTGTLECVWFGRQDWLERMYGPGDEVAVSGVLGWFRGKPQMSHPDIESLGDDEDGLVHTGRIIPVYQQTSALVEAGLNARGMRRLIRTVLTALGEVPDPLPTDMRDRFGLPALRDTFQHAHFPENMGQALRARQRLVFDEFLGLELALIRRKHARAASGGGIAFPDVGATFERLLGRLPFALTDGQKQVLREIRRDMRRPAPMSRLLQGDVGSGKTLVALFAAVMAADNGYQTAIMAPTEVLAEQHAITVGRLLFEVGLDSVLITGSTPAAQRRRALDEVATGQVSVVIGTHALLTEDTVFARLGLVVVDEQHRFGVLQREALRRKADPMPDLLVMTATPIPRSLAQTLYGDLDVSILGEKPPGRQPIVTKALRHGNAGAAWQAVRSAVERGEQAYIVFPLIDKSEALDIRAATEAYEDLRENELKGCRVALLHGRMQARERDETMQAFKAGRIDVLVSTTVIEVGVDVPNATVMVIEGAERFGLSQLHQLRGRIGRGTSPSQCFTVASAGELSDEAKRRLRAIVETEDGFRLAEVDLEIRGPGEFFGTKQSGLPEFRLGHIVRDAPILNAAREEAECVITVDPNLSSPEHAGLLRLSRPYEAILQRMEDDSAGRTVA